MNETHSEITDKLAAFIRRQKVFFVATAPAALDGRVNVSPKGYDSVAIIDPKTVAYLDLGGSGIETFAHVRENGRITLMVCAFEGAPDIVRVYGTGRAVGFDDPGFAELIAHFPAYDRARAVIVIDVREVTESCGWGVPLMEFRGERPNLRNWIEHKPVDEWKSHRYMRNAVSLDGLPGLLPPK